MKTRSFIRRKYFRCTTSFSLLKFINYSINKRKLQKSESFLDSNGFLCQNLSKEFDRHQRRDYLHLNWRGVAQLGRLIRSTVLLRAHGGVDKRKRGPNRVDGRTYRDVAAPVEEHSSGQRPV